VNGFLIIDKPEGLTSHDVVNHIRKKFHIRKVGHAGTLDPMATGVLVLLLGETTKKFIQFSNFDKEYEVRLTLGIKTNTGDIQGKIIKIKDCDDISKEAIEEIFNKFTGEIEQIPPMVSALRYKGQRLYMLARRGVDLKLNPRKIKIHCLRLIDFELPHIDFFIHCSKGTYVRKLAEDMGNVFGYGGCISKIRRLSVGPFNIKDAIKVQEINESHLRRWKN